MILCATLMFAHWWPLDVLFGTNKPVILGETNYKLAAPWEMIDRGRMLLQEGDLPRAIFLYRLALEAYPANRELQQDLLAARSLVNDPARVRASLREFNRLRNRLNAEELFIGFAFSLTIIAFSAVKYFTSRPVWAKPILLAAIAACLVNAGLALVIERQKAIARKESFAIVYQPTILREGNGASYPARMPVSVGVEVAVLERRGAWVQAALADGTIGWMHKDHLHIYEPSDDDG